jgi:hypothetical protein
MNDPEIPNAADPMPAAPQPAIEPSIPSWAIRFCPVLTHASYVGEALSRVLKPIENRIVAPGQLQAAQSPVREADAIACAGPACAWYIAAQNDKGELTGHGECSMQVAAIGANQQAMATMVQTNALITNYKLRTK